MTVNKQLKHLHFGTGKFGLGFVADFSFDLGLDLILVNRKSRSSEERNKTLSRDKKYNLKPYFNRRLRRPKEITSFNVILYEDEIENSHITNTIIDPSTILITTSVRPANFQHIVPLIINGLEMRIDDINTQNPLFIIACENLNKNSTELMNVIIKKGKRSLKKKFEINKHKVVFCNTVVDRLCQDIKINEEDKSVNVIVEPFREWIIEKNENTNYIEKLTKDIKEIKFVDNIEPYEKRKLWCINGIHIALATLAKYRDEGIDYIHQAINDTDILDLINKIKCELISVLCEEYSREFNQDNLDEFFESYFNRISGSNDKVTRIMKDFLFYDERMDQLYKSFADELLDKPIPKSLRTFLDSAILVSFVKLHERICEPIELSYDKYDKLLPYTTMLLQFMVSLLALERKILIENS